MFKRTAEDYQWRKTRLTGLLMHFVTAMYSEFGVNEEGMVANPPGGSGGFGGSSPAAGPTAGYDPTFKLDGRNK